MNRTLLTCAAAALTAGFILVPAFADTMPGNICTENAANGCVANITVTLKSGTIMTLRVGSDGEGSFDPFEYGADITDGMNFRFNGGGITVTDLAFPWTDMKANGGGPIANDGSTTYVLPSDLSDVECGMEPETTCEPVGLWDLSQAIMANATGDKPLAFTILAPDGVRVSDTISVFNSPFTGKGVVQFESDPDVPEPSTVVLAFGAMFLLRYCASRRGHSAHPGLAKGRNRFYLGSGNDLVC